ncbi:MAG: ABC transporter permease [Bryobacteraceae bacterium]|jgi:predicted permease
MERFGEIWRRLLYPFRRRQLNRDLEEEMRFHLEMKESQNREAGMCVEDARFAARRQFGNPAHLREVSGDMWGWGWLERAGQDLRYALRALWKSPGFTIAAIATLAVAIAADCVVFSVADAVLFRPLPYKEPDRLYNVFCGWRGHPATFGPSLADFLDWRRRNSVFEDMALTGGSLVPVGIGEYPELIDATATTTNLFDLLGVEPVLGRTFLPEEGYSGRAEQVAILGYDFWRKRFNGDPNILGKQLDFRPGPKPTVIGVLPANFKFTYPKAVSIWLPLAVDQASGRNNSGYAAIGRLKPGVTPSQARDGMRAVLAGLAREYPQTNRDRLEVQLISVRGWTTRQVRSIIITLLGAVTFVLLIGCTNVANLMLARLTDRDRETIVRAALGATRWRLVRGFLVESLVVALAAGAFGLLLSDWGLNLLRSLLPPELPRGDEVRLDSSVAWFALTMSLGTTIAFGLLPALRCSQVHLLEGLTGSSASMGARRGRGVRISLVVAETALALVLTGGAGLMMNSFIRLMHVDLGFNPKNLLSVSGWLGRRVAHDEEHRAWDRMVEAIRAIPGVRQAAIAFPAPLVGGEMTIGVRLAPKSPPTQVRGKVVTGEYFATMQIPLLAGRVFTSQDTEKSAPVAIVSQSLARLLFPDGGALDRNVFPMDQRIVGVVADARNKLLFPPEPEIYMPVSQTDMLHQIIVRYDEVGKAGLNGRIRLRLNEIAPDAQMSIRSFEEAIAQQGAQTRFLTALIVGAGLLGLLLSASGVFGVTAYSVNRRTRELGLRMALGAAPRDVLRMIVREAILMASAGAVIGTAAIFALRSVIRNLLFEVPPGDPITLIAAVAVLGAASTAAGYIPAHRVLNIDPAVALRYE